MGSRCESIRLCVYPCGLVYGFSREFDKKPLVGQLYNWVHEKCNCRKRTSVVGHPVLMRCGRAGRAGSGGHGGGFVPRLWQGPGTAQVSRWCLHLDCLWGGAVVLQGLFGAVLYAVSSSMRPYLEKRKGTMVPQVVFHPWALLRSGCSGALMLEAGQSENDRNDRHCRCLDGLHLRNSCAFIPRLCGACCVCASGKSCQHST